MEEAFRTTAAKKSKWQIVGQVTRPSFGKLLRYFWKFYDGVEEIHELRMIGFGRVAEANLPAFLASLPVGFGGFCLPGFDNVGDAVPIFRRVEKSGVQSFDEAVAAAADFRKNRQIADAHRFYHRQGRPFVVAGGEDKIPLGHDFPIVVSALAPQESDGGI